MELQEIQEKLIEQVLIKGGQKVARDVIAHLNYGPEAIRKELGFGILFSALKYYMAACAAGGMPLAEVAAKFEEASKATLQGFEGAVDDGVVDTESLKGLF